MKYGYVKLTMALWAKMCQKWDQTKLLFQAHTLPTCNLSPVGKHLQDDYTDENEVIRRHPSHPPP
jgi:hypothetical protein